MTGLPTLTIDQPYPTLILAGAKGMETRPSPPAGDMCPPGVRAYPGLRINRGDRIGLHAAAARVPRVMLKLGIGDYTLEQDNPRGTAPAYLLRGPRLAWPYRLPLGAMVGTARVVDAVPIVEGTDELTAAGPRPCVVMVGESLTLYHPSNPGGLADGADLDDQLPYGVWRPGRWAWLLGGIQRTTERCPGCVDGGLEEGIVPCVAHRGQPMDEACFACWNGEPCPVCDGTGRCDPIPAKGRQGLWSWSPGGES